MIALCFSMCREIGENHEAAANVQLKLIESQPWGKDSPAQGGPSGRRCGWMEAALGDPPRWSGQGFLVRLVLHLASPEEAKRTGGPAPLSLSFRLGSGSIDPCSVAKSQSLLRNWLSLKASCGLRLLLN